MKKIRLEFIQDGNGDLEILEAHASDERSLASFHIYQNRLLEITIKCKKLKRGDMLLVFKERLKTVKDEEIFRRIIRR